MTSTAVQILVEIRPWDAGSHHRSNHPRQIFVNRLRGVGVLTPHNFAISIGLAGRSYNSVSTAVYTVKCIAEFWIGQKRTIEHSVFVLNADRNDEKILENFIIVYSLHVTTGSA